MPWRTSFVTIKWRRQLRSRTDASRPAYIDEMRNLAVATRQQTACIPDERVSNLQQRLNRRTSKLFATPYYWARPYYCRFAVTKGSVSGSRWCLWNDSNVATMMRYVASIGKEPHRADVDGKWCADVAATSAAAARNFWISRKETPKDTMRRCVTNYVYSTPELVKHLILLSKHFAIQRNLKNTSVADDASPI